MSGRPTRARLSVELYTVRTHTHVAMCTYTLTHQRPQDTDIHGRAGSGLILHSIYILMLHDDECSFVPYM